MSLFSTNIVNNIEFTSGHSAYLIKLRFSSKRKGRFVSTQWLSVTLPRSSCRRGTQCARATNFWTELIVDVDRFAILFADRLSLLAHTLYNWN